MSVRETNIVEIILKQLGVKFTKQYVQKLYNKEPHGNSLYGISNILSEYNIRNKAFRIKSIEELKSIEPPFCINFEGKIAVINKLTDEKVLCKMEGKNIDLPIQKFREIWDSIILLAETDKNSIEPDYKEHRVKYLFNLVRERIFIITSLFIFIAGFFINNLHSSPELIFLSLISLTGIYIGYLLLQKQMHIRNSQADKICSIMKNGSCNGVLNSPAAKIMGVVGWSEIGLSYFISNIIITMFSPYLIPYLALINICALPYSVWSVWYQKYKVGQWCPLCLITQLLLWITFAINLVFGFISFPRFSVLELILTGCIYLMPILVINILLPKLWNDRYIENIEREIHNLRLNTGVFKTLLKQQAHHHIDQSVSQIIFGKKDSDIIITVVTNPHCTPCAMAHKRIEKLLEKTDNKIGVQYLFTSFNEELESSSRFLTSVYLSDEIASEKKKEIYSEWFEKGKYNKEDFFKKYNPNIDNETVTTEINKHKQWNGLQDVYGTPTIFINGYQLPSQYEVDDLKYFLDLEI